MSRKRSEEALEEHHERFVAGARLRGVEGETAERIWTGIQGFSGFGFPKAHSAAFGLLAYQSAWLRVHYAAEFLCSLLNEQPMGFYPPDALVHEAQRRDVEVLPPDVNRSGVKCHVEPRDAGEPGVRIGLGYVIGVKEREMEALVEERERGGPYAGVADLSSRSGAGRDGLERLAWAGALGTSPREGRREAFWRLGVAGSGRHIEEGTQLALPLEPPRAPELAPLQPWETMLADYSSTGMTLGEHGSINLIVPQSVFERFRAIVRTAPLIRARGRLERREGTINVLVEEIAALEQPDLRAVAPAGHAFGRRG